MKEQAMSQKVKLKQATIEDSLVCRCEQEKESTASIDDFMCALYFAGLSLQHAGNMLGDLVNQYC